jgi:hypothetical protein
MLAEIRANRKADQEKADAVRVAVRNCDMNDSSASQCGILSGASCLNFQNYTFANFIKTALPGEKWRRGERVKCCGVVSMIDIVTLDVK